MAGLDPAIQGRHLELTAEGGVDKADGNLAKDVVSLAFEKVVGRASDE